MCSSRFQSYRLGLAMRFTLYWILIPGDYSGRNELPQRVGRGLQGSTNDHDRRAQEDGLPSTKWVSNKNCGYSSKETTDIVRSNGNTCCSVNDLRCLGKPLRWLPWIVDLWVCWEGVRPSAASVAAVVSISGNTLVFLIINHVAHIK